MRPIELVDACSLDVVSFIPDGRRWAECEEVVVVAEVLTPVTVLLKLLWRDFVLAVVPWCGSTTDDAGELPGVDTIPFGDSPASWGRDNAGVLKLLPAAPPSAMGSLLRGVAAIAAACSRESARFSVSKTKSTALISSWSSVHRRRISDWSRRISPLTVSLSLTPRSMIARTRSMAEP